MNLGRFISLAEPDHILIQIWKNKSLIYEGKHYLYPKRLGKEELCNWYLKNGIMIITLRN